MIDLDLNTGGLLFAIVSVLFCYLTKKHTSKLNDTIDNKITTSFEIGTITESTGNKLAIRSGVRIITVNGSSAVLFTKNQLYDMFQTTQGWPNNFCACVMNGDGSGNAAHIDGTTNSESSLKVVLDRSQSNALLRVCYTIFYWY